MCAAGIDSCSNPDHSLSYNRNLELFGYPLQSGIASPGPRLMVVDIVPRIELYHHGGRRYVQQYHPKTQLGPLASIVMNHEGTGSKL